MTDKNNDVERLCLLDADVLAEEEVKATSEADVGLSTEVEDMPRSSSNTEDILTGHFENATQSNTHKRTVYTTEKLSKNDDLLGTVEDDMRSTTAHTSDSFSTANEDVSQVQSHVEPSASSAHFTADSAQSESSGRKYDSNVHVLKSIFAEEMMVEVIIPAGIAICLVPCESDADDEQLKLPNHTPESYYHPSEKNELENRILSEQAGIWILKWTFQWHPYTKRWESSTARKALWVFAQFVMVALLTLYFFFEMGAFVNIPTPMVLDWNFKITRAKNILWEFRWVAANIFGIIYFRKRHLESLLFDLSIPKRIWNKFNVRRDVLLVVVFTFVVVIPFGLNLVMINLLDYKPEELWQEVIHMSGFLLCRLASLPIFLVLTADLHLIGTQIRVLGDKIFWTVDTQRREDGWGKGESGNDGEGHSVKRNLNHEIWKLKSVIRYTQNILQYFVIFHLFMLLCTSFLGVLSYVERMRFQIAENSSSLMYPIVLHKELEKAMVHQIRLSAREQERFRISKLVLAKMLNFSPNSSPSELKAADVTRPLFQLINATLFDGIQDKINNPQNLTSNWEDMKNLSPEKMSFSVLERVNKTRVIIQTLLDFVESILLYGMPLFMLIRIDTSLVERLGKLIDLEGVERQYDLDDPTKEIIAFWRTIEGIKIFGFQATLFRALILTMAAPLIVSLIHSLFAYVEIPK